MKSFNTIFVLLLSIISTSLLFPQTALNKGNYSLSGSISYSHLKSSTENYTSSYELKNDVFSFSPAFGFFIIDNLLIGGNISFLYNESISKMTTSSGFREPLLLENKNIQRNLNLGPTIRYYFASVSFLPFIEVDYNYSKTFGSDRYGHVFDFSAGINYFISKSVALEPYLSYSIGKFKNPDMDTNSFFLGIRVNYFIVKNE